MSYLGNKPAANAILFSNQKYISRDKATTMHIFYEPDYITYTEHDTNQFLLFDDEFYHQDPLLDTIHSTSISAVIS